MSFGSKSLQSDGRNTRSIHGMLNLNDFGPGFIPLNDKVHVQVDQPWKLKAKIIYQAGRRGYNNHVHPLVTSTGFVKQTKRFACKEECSLPPILATPIGHIKHTAIEVGEGGEFYPLYGLAEKTRCREVCKLNIDVPVSSWVVIYEIEPRQLGFSDRRLCPHLCKLAADYISKREGSEENVYDFFSREPDGDSLFIKLVEEFERCILSYFAFHWSYAELALTQVLQGPESEPKKKLKDMVLAATREQRFARVTKNLKVARVFNTLVEEMKAIGLAQQIDDSKCTDVMAPVAHKDRSPVLLLMGGGMGAGKSTVLKDILKEPFWAEAAENAVIIEADAFKESDVIYKALSSRCHHDIIHTAELVHQSSTDAASSVLVTALNEGRDVIMDGTLSWVPFVVQTITMARNVHRKRYRMGAGYRVADDGTVTENYWEQVEDDDPGAKKRRPYRIELVGIVCDAYLAVIRGIRRAIMCRRAVRVRSQLKSHKRFASAFTTYCNLVDNARLFSTNALEGPAKLIGWKERDKTLLIDPEEFKVLNMVGDLNEEAESIYDLYKGPSPVRQPGCVWKDIVLSPSRKNIQMELKYAIQRVERTK